MCCLHTSEAKRGTVRRQSSDNVAVYDLGFVGVWDANDGEGKVRTVVPPFNRESLRASEPNKPCRLE